MTNGDDQIVKQFPYDLKFKATANGYRIHAHVYGKSSDGVVTESVSMILKAMMNARMKENTVSSKRPEDNSRNERLQVL